MIGLERRILRAWPVLVLIASVVAGVAFWTGTERPLYALALLPLAWAWCRRWWHRYAAAVAYAAIGLWPVQPSVGTFFGASGGWFPWIVWVTFTLVWSLPFVLVRGEVGSNRQAAINCFVLTATLIPPWGILAWCHPALAAGWLFPGGGVVALAGLVVVWTLAMRLRPAYGLLLAIILLAQGLASSRDVDGLVRASREVQVHAFDTQMLVPGTVAEVAQHVARIGEVVTKLPNDGAIALFPETTLANWRPSTEAAVRYALRDVASNHPMILGTTWEEGGARFGGAAILSDRGIRKFIARQPLPLSLWRPWDPQSHHEASWLEDSVVELGGKRFAVRICSEEMTIFWAALDSARGGRIDAAAGLVNAWWMTTRTQVVSHAVHARAGALLMGVPLVRAINWPSSLPPFLESHALFLQ